MPPEYVEEPPSSKDAAAILGDCEKNVRRAWMATLGLTTVLSGLSYLSLALAYVLALAQARGGYPGWAQALERVTGPYSGVSLLLPLALSLSAGLIETLGAQTRSFRAGIAATFPGCQCSSKL